MMHTLHSLSLILLCLCAILTGCTSSPAATPAETATSDAAAEGIISNTYDIPLYPDARPPETDTPLETIIGNMKEQMEQEQPDVEVDGYVLPEGVTFEQVMNFYDDELTQRGWEEDSAGGGQEFANGATGAWTRNDDQEGVALVVMGDPTQQGRVVMFVIYGPR